MCGIAGAFAAGVGARLVPDAIGPMTTCLAHRGPDDAGLLVDEDAGVALGHRRLSIVDLSPEGHQPMRSASERFAVVFNGEIYNYRALGAELAALGHRFRGHSDTEVILAAVEQWGLADAVRRLVGIFAFGLWDRAERTLSLVRDHLGVKPLYYAWAGRTLVFGSELRALSRYPGLDTTIDRGALALLLRHNCIPAPYTIYRGARKLPPGTILTVRAGAAPGADVPAAYWSARAVALAGLADPLDLSREAAADALHALLRDAVGLQMVADVPLGAFLSGGVDSTTVVALMQAQSARPVRTFSIGFDDGAFDEAGHARAVAAHLGTAHTELYVTEREAREVVPLLPRIYDEPFSDSSQIPTYLVSRMARAHVTVSLSGDGGDELFAGYNRHVWGDRLWRRMRAIPRPARRFVSRALASVPPATWDRRAAALPLLGQSRRVGAAHLGAKLHKLAGVLGADGAERLYLELASHWRQPGDVVLGATEPPTLTTAPGAWLEAGGFTEGMMYLDLVTYLPDDILVKVDRASMAVGLEARVPLLDHRVVEFAWRLPLAHKLRDGVGKQVLRDVLHRYVPRELIERPKAGFSVPLANWLRGPLRAWAEALLSPDRLRADGYFDPAPIRAAWDEHQSGRRDRAHDLWDVLTFQSWYHEGGRES